MESIALRPITPEDEAFLLSVYRSAREAEMAMVPWAEDQKEAFIKAQFQAQQDHYLKTYRKAEHLVILSNGEAVGRLYVDRTDEAIDVLDLTLLPQYRNAGIGTSLIKELLDEAGAKGKRVRIYVELFNPSLRLFERLGFTKVGEEGIHFLLEWQSSPENSL